MDYAPYIAAVILAALQIISNYDTNKRMEEESVKDRDRYTSSSLFMIILIIVELIFFVTKIIKG